MSKLRELTRTWLRWAAEMEDKHGQPVAAGLAADMGLIEQERVMSDYTGPMKTGAEESLRNQLVYCKEHRTLTSVRPDGMPKWCDEVAALEQRMERLKEALEHCGYDPTDCIDCGGPPHNEWCRFWKLRDIVPILFASQEEA